jgi:hypothetical protein
MLRSYGPIQICRPRFGIGDERDTVPKLDVRPTSTQCPVKIRFPEKQRIIRFSTPERSLIQNRPAKLIEHRLNEGLFEACFCVLSDPLSLLSPEQPEASHHVLGGATEVSPLGFQAQTMFKPVIGQQILILNRPKRQRELSSRHIRLSLWISSQATNTVTHNIGRL